MSIIWKGVSGLRWCHLLSSIQELQVKYPVPKLLVIQCGGNDIADISLSGLQKFMKRTLREIFEIFPTTRIVWSQILPRSCWRYAISNISAEISRKRISSSIATFVLNHGWASIKYLEISAFHPTLILPDGVHLKNLGNFHYLTTLQNALKQFIQNGSNKSPSL